MKNFKKLMFMAVIFMIGCIFSPVTTLCDTGTGISVYTGGTKTVGREDGSYRTMEKYATDDEIYECIEDAYFSTPVIEKILNDGRCLGYIDQLKAEGWISQDFIPDGSKSSSTTQTETKTETPADNQTATSETKEQPKTDTKTETKAEPTQEEIDAAWEETERTEATCTADGKIVYTNSITGDTKEESIPAAGHDYEVTETANATCTEDGTNTYTCETCGDTYEEVIPATGHTEGGWTVTKEAGMFSAGEKTLVCKKCGEVLKTEKIQQMCPLPLVAVIGIVAGVIIAVVILIVMILKKKKGNR